MRLTLMLPMLPRIPPAEPPAEPPKEAKVRDLLREAYGEEAVDTFMGRRRVGGPLRLTPLNPQGGCR